MHELNLNPLFLRVEFYSNVSQKVTKPAGPGPGFRRCCVQLAARPAAQLAPRAMMYLRVIFLRDSISSSLCKQFLFVFITSPWGVWWFFIHVDDSFLRYQNQKKEVTRETTMDQKGSKRAQSHRTAQLLSYTALGRDTNEASSSKRFLNNELYDIDLEPSQRY